MSSEIFAQENAKLALQERYICVKGDISMEKAGKCPNHNIDLLKGNEAGIKQFIELNTKVATQKADSRFVCVKGDISQTNEGICPNHQIALINSKDKKTIEISRDEWTKENTKRKIEISVRHLCSRGDFSSEKGGKCPKHSIDLIRADDEIASKSIVAETK